MLLLKYDTDRMQKEILETSVFSTVMTDAFTFTSQPSVQLSSAVTLSKELLDCFLASLQALQRPSVSFFSGLLLKDKKQIL